MTIPLVENNRKEAALHFKDDNSIQAKEQRLRLLFQEMGSAIVAFSGGVDSSYVAFVATSELGKNAVCITGDSASLPSVQRKTIEDLSRQFGLRHEVIETNELDDSNYTANDGSRCYFCKDELYTKLADVARVRKIPFIVDGSTCDDLGDYRPGRVAAAEHRVRSPLIEAEMTKAEVRVLSNKAGLPTWDQPASPCLSSRIAYGIPVTIARLTEVDRGEQILRELGFREFRVRHHDNLVRLEISRAEMQNALSLTIFDELARRFRELGFKYVTFDLDGYRSGAMNEALKGSA
ncbi:MAG: ATP-dependent sacrificial sulfur transferase LarE [bacterium]